MKIAKGIKVPYGFEELRLFLLLLFLSSPFPLLSPRVDK